MDRLNARTSMAYWKISGVLLTFILITSVLSSKCHEDNTMSRKHLLKYKGVIRTAMQHSIQSSQDTDVATSFYDVCIAKCAVDIISNMLTPYQIRAIANIDIFEMQEFISKQHEDATELLMEEHGPESTVEANKTMLGGFVYKH